MKKTTEIDEHRKNRAFNGILKMHTQRERERERGGERKRDRKKREKINWNISRSHYYIRWTR